MPFQSRFGWVGQKVGMTNVVKEGKVLPITLVKIFKQHVLSKIKSEDYYILRVGVEINKLKAKPQIVEMKKLNKPLCNFVKEFKVSETEADSVVESYGISLLEHEVFVDVSGKNIGKGFAGGMKRWNFSGAGASHGTSLTHRAIGSTGTRDKNWPGKKMPGRMGNKNTTIQNISVCEIDEDLNLVALHGAIPGKNGNIVILKKAIKKQGVKL